jgi:hypothetical protein
VEGEVNGIASTCARSAVRRFGERLGSESRVIRRESPGGVRRSVPRRLHSSVRLLVGDAREDSLELAA